MSSPFVKPARPTNLHAPGAVDALLAFHRASFGGWKMQGPPAPVGAPDPAPAPAAPPAPPAPTPAPSPADVGFPADTPVEQMKPAEQAAYYKAQTQKWQGRAESNYSALRTLGITDPAQVAGVKTKLDGYTALERASMDAQQLAVAEASDKATAAARADLVPKLVKAEFKAAAAGKITDDRLATILDPLDLSKFLTASGDVDTKKVSDYVAGLQPDKGTQRLGPSAFGLGSQLPQSVSPGDQGRAMAARRGFIKTEPAGKS